MGEIRRQDVVVRFGVQSAPASRDLTLYRDLAPGNLDYAPRGKSYMLGPEFRPISVVAPSGKSSRSRWYVRAFERQTREFRDFVITRIKNPVVLKGQPVAPHEVSDQDIQWTRVVEPELVPHPDQPRPEITEMNYGMQSGVLRVKLRKWSVDCSPDHSLREHEYSLWLKDHLAIYGMRSAVLAPMLLVYFIWCRNEHEERKN